MYALGVVAYELLSGAYPFHGPDYGPQHLKGSAEPITGIPERLRSLVSECLYKPAEARPRPQNLLARLKTSMEAASPGGTMLQRANVIAVERQAEAARQQSAAQAEAERRGELYAVAEQRFQGILSLFGRQIKDNAPSVREGSRSSLNRWSLNDADLSVDSPKAVGKEADRNLPFEVIAHAKISVSRPVNHGRDSGRSHSLWYCNAQEPEGFRWYETAFWDRSTYGREDGFIPFAMPPDGRDTTLALSNTLHTHSLARPFMPIDQEDEESFVERWLGWFAQAAQGQLRRPGSMPESDPQGSWRRRR